MKNFDDNLLHELLSNGDLKEIEKFLYKYGINSVDRDGRTLLMTAVTERKNEIVKLIIEAGGDVNAQDYQGLSALHFAAFCDNDTAAGMLLDAGADVNGKDKQGNTPILRLVMKNGKKSKCYKVFLEKGADVNEENNHGVSAANIMQ